MLKELKNTIAGRQSPESSTSPKDRKISAVSDLIDASSAASSTLQPSFMDNHVFTQLKKRLGNQTMVIGHRGGFLDGPENSIRGFRAAIEHQIEGVEFDVSDNSYLEKFKNLPR
jgi:hypothetical protein